MKLIRKKNERITKAVAIIFIVGFALLYNTNFNGSNIEKSGIGIHANLMHTDTIKGSESRFIDCSKSIIRSGIHFFLSNLQKQ